MSTLKRKSVSNGAGPDAKKSRPDGNLMSFFAAAPKNPAAAGSSSGPSSFPAAARFNKEKWAAGLDEEKRRLLKLEIDTMHESWLSVLKEDIVTNEFLELKRFLSREAQSGKKVFPPVEEIYSWTRHTPFHTVKVVIVGQDPYHNHNQAHGLAFSVRPPTPAPPSLRNMYIALKNDYPDFRPPPNKAGLLTPWADRGVLLLNTCLTVRAHDAKSHANRGWERLTQRVIDLVAARRPRGVVFMAWGTPASMCVKKIDAKKHLVLRAVHPSPLSAHRGFFTCGHFKAANGWLVERYGAGSEVDWNLTPAEKKVEVAVEVKKTEVEKTVVKKSEVAVAGGDGTEVEAVVKDKAAEGLVEGIVEKNDVCEKTVTGVLEKSDGLKQKDSKDFSKDSNKKNERAGNGE